MQRDAHSGSSLARSHRWLPRTVGQRVVGFVALGLAGITLAVGYDLWAKTAHEVELSEISRLEGVAAALAQTLDGDLHESWSESLPSRDELKSWDEAPAALQSARRVLVDTQHAAEIVSPIYTLRLRREYVDQVRANPTVPVPQAMEFFLTGADEPYWRHTYQYRPEMAAALFGGSISSSHSYRDEHGQWLSAYAPVLNAAGGVVGIVEVDAPMDSRLIGAKHRISGHVAGLLVCFFGSLILVGVLHTDMRRHELETEKLAMVAMRTDNGVLITDPNGTVEWSNEGFTRLSGWNLCDVERKPIEARLRSPESPESFHNIRMAMEAGAPATCQLQSNRRSGDMYWSSLDLQPIRNAQGHLTHWVIVQSDITQQKKTEQLMEEARDQAIRNTRLQNEFLANVSHELRTPLTAVLGTSSLLTDTKLSDEQAEFVGIIGTAGKLLLDQITELMEYAQLRAGDAEMKATNVAPRTLVANLMETLLPEASQSGLALEWSLEESVPDRFLGDPDRIEQVLNLLLSNAFKFTEAGSVSVGVTLDSGRVLFQVRDTGIGISEGKLSGVFDSFRQADGSSTRKFGGKGLGLALAFRLVEVMQGEIGVESTVGSGSTFWFALPCERGAKGSGTTAPQGSERSLAEDLAA